MGGGGEQGGLGWSSNPSTVFKCLHMSAFSLNSIGEPLRLPALMFLPCGNLLCTARLQPIIGPPFFFQTLLSYYQWVRLCGKQGRNGRGKVWHLILTKYMRICSEIDRRASWDLPLLMWQNFIIQADAWEWRQLDCGVIHWCSMLYVYIQLF